MFWIRACSLYVFVAVFLGCTSTGRVGLCLRWFYVQELPRAQPAVVLVLKRVVFMGLRLSQFDVHYWFVFLNTFEMLKLYGDKEVSHAIEYERRKWTANTL